MHQLKHRATGFGFLVRNSRRLLSPAEKPMRRGVGAAAGRCQPFTTIATISEHANWYSSGISRAVKDSTSVKGNSIWLGQYFRRYMTSVNHSKQFGIYHGKHEMLPGAVRTLASNYAIDSSGRISKEAVGLHFRFIAENQHYRFRQFSVFNEFSKQLKGEAKSNSEFQQSVKEFNKKIEVVKEDLKVRTKMTTEKLHKSVDDVWTEAEATAKKVSANVKEKISAATEEVKDTIGLGKQESERSTNTSTSSFGKDESFGAKDESSTRTRAENSESSEASNSNESAGQTGTLFGRFKSAVSSASPTVSLAFQKWKEMKISDLARKGYDMVIDELSSNPSRRRRMQYASAPTSSVDRSTKTDIVIVPTKRSRVSEKWEAFKNKMQGHPIFKRVSGISQPVVTKGQELAEDMRERWETSDHPVVHKIQDLSETVLGETATALSFKEIRRRDPSFSLPDFVAEVQEMVRPVLIAYLKGDLDTLKKYCSSEVIERCKGERKAFESQGMFFDNKILHISEIDVRETKMMGSTPIIIVGFQTQQIYCVRDREGEVTAGGQDTIQTVYYAWAMQQLDTEELGEGAYFPVWRLREMQQIGVQALI